MFIYHTIRMVTQECGVLLCYTLFVLCFTLSLLQTIISSTLLNKSLTRKKHVELTKVVNDVML